MNLEEKLRRKEEANAQRRAEHEQGLAQRGQMIPYSTADQLIRSGKIVKSSVLYQLQQPTSAEFGNTDVTIMDSLGNRYTFTAYLDSSVGAVYPPKPQVAYQRMAPIFFSSARGAPHIENVEMSIGNIRYSNEVVIPMNKIRTIYISYPGGYQDIFEHRSTNLRGFTKDDLARAVAEDYRRLYQVGRGNPNHPIGDLVLEQLLQVGPDLFQPTMGT